MIHRILKNFAYLCIGLSTQALLHAHNQNNLPQPSPNSVVQFQQPQWQAQQNNPTTTGTPHVQAVFVTAHGIVATSQPPYVSLANYHAPFAEHYPQLLGDHPNDTVGNFFKARYVTDLRYKDGIDELYNDQAEVINTAPAHGSLVGKFLTAAATTAGIGAAAYMYTKKTDAAIDAIFFSSAAWWLYTSLSNRTVMPDQERVNARKQALTEAIGNYFYTKLEDAYPTLPAETFDTISNRLDEEQEFNVVGPLAIPDLPSFLARQDTYCGRAKEIHATRAGVTLITLGAAVAHLLKENK